MKTLKEYQFCCISNYSDIINCKHRILKHGFLAIDSSIVVEHLTPNPKIESSNPTASIERERAEMVHKPAAEELN
jgi:hypothetical protein